VVGLRIFNKIASIGVRANMTYFTSSNYSFNWFRFRKTIQLTSILGECSNLLKS